MNCNKCQRKRTDTTTTGGVNGLGVTMPCSGPVEQVSFTCGGFANPVDSAATQDSTCGECKHYTNNGKSESHKCLLTLTFVSHKGATACVKFKAKPTAAIPALGRDCKSFVAIDHGSAGMCEENSKATCNGDGESCEAARERGRRA